jgi:hypothetical protein
LVGTEQNQVFGRYILLSELTDVGESKTDTFLARRIYGDDIGGPVLLSRMPSTDSEQGPLGDWLRLANRRKRLQHPAVVQTIEIGQYEGLLFEESELPGGQSLARILKQLRSQGNHPPFLFAVAIASALLEFLQELQEEHGGEKSFLTCLHCNQLFLSGDGRLRLLHVGMPRLASRRFMAPEIRERNSPDAKTDVWVAGWIMRCVLVGSLRANQKPRVPGRYAALGKELLKYMLAKRTEDRWSSAQALIKLRKILSVENIEQSSVLTGVVRGAQGHNESGDSEEPSEEIIKQSRDLFLDFQNKSKIHFSALVDHSTDENTIIRGGNVANGPETGSEDGFVQSRPSRDSDDSAEVVSKAPTSRLALDDTSIARKPKLAGEGETQVSRKSTGQKLAQPLPPVADFDDIPTQAGMLGPNMDLYSESPSSVFFRPQVTRSDRKAIPEPETPMAGSDTVASAGVFQEPDPKSLVQKESPIDRAEDEGWGEQTGFGVVDLDGIDYEPDIPLESPEEPAIVDEPELDSPFSDAGAKEEEKDFYDHEETGRIALGSIDEESEELPPNLLDAQISVGSMSEDETSDTLGMAAEQTANRPEEKEESYPDDSANVDEDPFAESLNIEVLDIESAKALLEEQRGEGEGLYGDFGEELSGDTGIDASLKQGSENEIWDPLATEMVSTNAIPKLEAPLPTDGEERTEILTPELARALVGGVSAEHPNAALADDDDHDFRTEILTPEMAHDLLRMNPVQEQPDDLGAMEQFDDEEQDFHTEILSPEMAAKFLQPEPEESGGRTEVLTPEMRQALLDPPQVIEEGEDRTEILTPEMAEALAKGLPNPDHDAFFPSEETDDEIPYDAKAVTDARFSLGGSSETLLGAGDETASVFTQGHAVSATGAAELQIIAPKESRIFVDGENCGVGSMTVPVDSAFAKIVLRIHCPGYHPWSANVSMNGETRVTLQPELKPRV